MSYGEVTTIVKEAKHRRSRQFGHRILTRIRRASPALDPGSHAQEGQDGAAAPPPRSSRSSRSSRSCRHCRPCHSAASATSAASVASAWGAGPARHVTAGARAPLAAPSALRVSRSRADHPLLLQERFPVFLHGREALSQLPGGGARPGKGALGLAEAKGLRERVRAAEVGGRSSLPGARLGETAQVSWRGQVLRARLLGGN